MYLRSWNSRWPFTNTKHKISEVLVSKTLFLSIVVPQIIRGVKGEAKKLICAPTNNAKSDGQDLQTILELEGNGD